MTLFYQLPVWVSTSSVLVSKLVCSTFLFSCLVRTTYVHSTMNHRAREVTLQELSSIWKSSNFSRVCFPFLHLLSSYSSSSVFPIQNRTPRSVRQFRQQLDRLPHRSTCSTQKSRSTGISKVFNGYIPTGQQNCTLNGYPFVRDIAFSIPKRTYPVLYCHDGGMFQTEVVQLWRHLRRRKAARPLGNGCCVQRFGASSTECSGQSHSNKKQVTWLDP